MTSTGDAPLLGFVSNVIEILIKFKKLDGYWMCQFYQGSVRMAALPKVGQQNLGDYSSGKIGHEA